MKRGTYLINSVLLKGRSGHALSLSLVVDIFHLKADSCVQENGKVELVFKKKKGEYIGVHAIYVYRYEKESEEEEEIEIESGIQGISRKGNIGLTVPTVIRDNRIRLLSIPFEKAEIEIFNIVGRKVYSGSLSGNVEIPFEKGSGAYILILKDVKTGKRIKRKLIRLK